MSDEADLDGYLARIKYSGSIAPTLPTLQAIHQLHPQAIPFENLDPLMELPVRLQRTDLEQKLLYDRRGGYCLEHNLLLKAMLEDMEFTVEPVLASVTWGHDPAEPLGPPGHVALLVDLAGGPYLVDVGFGGQVMTAPLKLRNGLEQETTLERYRLLEGGSVWRLETEINGEWKPVYAFETKVASPADLIALNDRAMLRHRDELLGARIVGSKRYALHNRRLRTHENGETETRELSTVAELREVLSGPFGIQLPTTDRLDGGLAKVLKPDLSL